MQNVQKIVGLVAMVVLVACGGGSPLAVSLKLSETEVRDGELALLITVQGADGIDTGTVFLDGELFAELKRVDATVYLATSTWSDGEHELTVRVEAGGRSGEATTSVTVRNPDVEVTRIEAPETVKPGDTVQITVDAPGATGVSADFRNLDPDAPAAGVEGFPSGTVTWTVSYTLPTVTDPEVGWVNVPLRVADANGRQLRISDVRMYLASGPLLPLRSDVGVFERSDLPAATGSADAQVTSVSGTLSVVSGGEVNVVVGVTGDLAGAQVLVAVDGYAGHLVIPVSLLAGEGVASAPAYAHGLRPGAPAPAQAPGSLVVPLTLPQGSLPNGVRESWSLRIALRDAAGQIADILEALLAVAEAESGQLRVSLSWDTPTDVDLHVVEPDGSEIYYGNRSSANGGELDLDSNAGCSIDGINQENVFWELPPNGEYIVRVDFWSDCASSGGEGYPANWRVVVSGCGLDESTEGSFAAGTSTHGGAGAGVEALRFTAECQPLFVKGTIKYERKLPLSGVLQTVALEGGKVRVVDEDGQVLGESIVGPGGTYAVLFDPPAGAPEAEVSLEVVAADSLVRVLPLSGDDPHTFPDGEGEDGHTWNPDDDPMHERDIVITAEKYAGAMHLFMVARKALTWGAGRGYASGNVMTVRWTAGSQPDFCTSCFSEDNDTVYVSGAAEDPDHFDDPVLTHEFGHRMHSTFGRNDQPGGLHSRFSQIVPPFAFGEGFATYVGQRIHGDAQYYDSFRGGVSKWRLDALEDRVPKGTDDSTSKGKMSEAVVAAIMWELQDPADSSGDDRVGGLEDAMLRQALEVMKQDDALGRGTAGKTDLPDLIGGIACGSSSEVKANIDNLLEKLFSVNWLDEEGFCQ